MGVAIKTKSFKVKAEESESRVGVFTGYASVFGNVDSYGDVMVQGAFADTLKEWEGRKIPVFYGHDLTNPENNIGYVESAEEDDTGLLVRCVVDTEGPGNGPVVYKLLKEGRIDRLSASTLMTQITRVVRHTLRACRCLRCLWSPPQLTLRQLLLTSNLRKRQKE